MAEPTSDRTGQPAVAPQEVDGVLPLTVGTALFALAALVGLLAHDRLLARDRGWWLGVALAGCALGLLGLAYCVRRRRGQRDRRLTGRPDPR